MMEAYFVTFYSPGTFVAETTTKPVESWDVDAAVKMAADIKERYNATPYGFRFTTKGRGPDDLDSKEIARSPFYWLGGKVETLEEIEARDNPKERILRSNMRGNGWKRVITTTEGWKWTQPLDDGDVLLPALHAQGNVDK
jgi:hypothetical protein